MCHVTFMLYFHINRYHEAPQITVEKFCELRVCVAFQWILQQIVINSVVWNNQYNIVICY